MQRSSQSNWKDVWVVVALTAILVGGAVYSWRESVSRKKVASLESQIADLQAKVDKAEELFNTNLNLPVCNRIWERQKSNQEFLRVLAPNGGESLCIGQRYDVQWETATTLRTVNLFVRKANGTPIHQLGTLPSAAVGKGTFTWPVGDAPGGAKVSEGSGYDVVVNAVLNGCLIADTSDTVFSIMRCP